MPCPLFLERFSDRCRLKLYRTLWCRWNKRQISNSSSVGYLATFTIWEYFVFDQVDCSMLWLKVLALYYKLKQGKSHNIHVFTIKQIVDVLQIQHNILTKLLLSWSRNHIGAFWERCFAFLFRRWPWFSTVNTGTKCKICQWCCYMWNTSHMLLFLSVLIIW